VPLSATAKIPTMRESLVQLTGTSQRCASRLSRSGALGVIEHCADGLPFSFRVAGDAIEGPPPAFVHLSWIFDIL